ncbi:MAG: hypothetical protein IKH67_03175 [Lachnospiraceae bacterium]|nr:hypothetical protein [Lachnospiraceae bacterium]MBR3004058.1 hypothetical protein [Lachnospiraceae bacterium]MBR6350427.1 hypothetical protein [Lachnospiraceae bacterium]
MPPFVWILIGVLVVLIVAIILLYVFGKRSQKKQEEQRAELEKQAMTINCFVIDKKRMRLKDAGFPKIVYDSAPRLSKIGKVSVLKVKIGNKVSSVMCDDALFKTILPKQELRAQIVGVYMLSAKRVRGPVYVAKEHRKKTDKFLDKFR